MAEEEVNFVSVLVLTFMLGALGVAIYLLFFKQKSDEKSITSTYEKIENDKSYVITSKTNQKTNANTNTKKKILKDTYANHPFLLASLKGHTGSVLSVDFSSNGKYLASCAEDRTARLWNVKDFTSKDHKYTRVNVEFDHASSISISPDSRAFIVSLATEKTLRVYKINKTKDDNGKSASISVSHESDFPKIHKSDILNVAIATTGKFIMSADKETQIIIWSLKGDVLEKIDTLLMYNSLASISPCGNLVAACGFTSDVKLWYVGFSKTNDFQQVTRAFELKGHTAGVLSFSFSNDCKRMATVSKDGTWKIWDIDVNYQKDQNAYLLHTGRTSPIVDNDHVHIALSHDYFTVALAVNTSLYLYNSSTHKLEESLEDVHQGNITKLLWHSDSRQLVSAGGSDRSIRIWHNPVGARANLIDLKGKLPKSKSDAMKERIQKQIEEANEYIARFDR